MEAVVGSGFLSFLEHDSDDIIAFVCLPNNSDSRVVVGQVDYTTISPRLSKLKMPKANVHKLTFLL